MSLILATSMAARIAAESVRDGSALAAWIAQYAAVPVVSLGYRRPPGAEGWPFVALVPAEDRRDLRRDRRRRGSESAAVAVACGYLLGEVDRGEAAGLIAVDALADAVLTAFEVPWRVNFRDDRWEARIASRVDAEFQHPRYELELLVEFGPVGAS